MEFLVTKDKIWIQKWDDFLFQENCGSHLLYSDWLKSYNSYGFDYEIFVVLEDGKIVGGYGAIVAKTLFLKFYIVPHGPIFRNNYQNFLVEVIEKLQVRASELGCCYVQYSLPISDEKEIANRTFSTDFIKKQNLKHPKGNLFKHVYSSYGINWVNFNGSSCAEELLSKFSVQVRRNINLSYKNNPEILFATTEEECQLAYKAIEDNGKSNNYSVRSYEDFKATILNLVQSNKAFLLYIKVNGIVKGAGFAVNSGNCLTYISGGTTKEKPDLKLGYLIHWEFMKKSFELGFSGYNISMGGSKGVVAFKSKFNTHTIHFVEPHYYVILRPNIFRIYTILNSIFVTNKKTISSLLKRFR